MAPECHDHRLFGLGEGILIAATVASELLPEITAAHENGLHVYAIDTPFQPEDAVEAYLATDNVAAGHLVGQYARVKAAELGLTPKIAMLNLAPGIVSGKERRQGFLGGFGIGADDPVIVASADTEGDQEFGRWKMTEILSRHPDVNIVYTVNEPAALGALAALKEARADLNRVVLVSVDGGCEAMKGALRGGESLSGFVDTGVRLITDDPAAGGPSADVAFGVRNCWG